MIKKRVLAPDRVRYTGKSFCFIPHRFLTGGFLESLSKEELLVYFFLALASDRSGLSFYGDRTIYSMLGLTKDEYLLARANLINKDLIKYDGTLFQVLSLPQSMGK